MSAMTIDLAPTEPRTQNRKPGDTQGDRSTALDRRPKQSGRPAAASQAGPDARFGAVDPDVTRLPVRGCVAERSALTAGPDRWAATRPWHRGGPGLRAELTVVAALAVIGLTAFRVTGDSYQGYGQSPLAQR